MTQAEHFLFRDVRQTRQHGLRAWPDADWPQPADAAAAAHFRADMQALADEAGLAPEVLGQPGAEALMACLGGNSPYLSDLARGDIAGFAALLESGPEHCARDAFAACAEFDAKSGREYVASFLRPIKQRVAFFCALADLGGIWTLEEVSGTLRRTAEEARDRAIRPLLWGALQAGQLALPSPARPAQGWVL